MRNEPQFDLNVPNIFMRLYFKDQHSEDEITITFVYSDTNGFEHLKKQLHDSDLFNGLLNPKEVFKKMSDKLATSFAHNNNLSLTSSEWNGALIIPYSTKGNDLLTEFNKWKIQLEKLVGKDNLFQVSIPEEIFNHYRDSMMNKNDEENDQDLFNYIESYRKKLDLENSLSINEINPKRLKL